MLILTQGAFLSIIGSEQPSLPIFSKEQLATFSSFNKKSLCNAQANQKIKKIPCNICNKLFRAYSELIQHNHVHTSERPYKCIEPTCNKSFLFESLLITHSRTHTGEKPYVCDKCNKSFSQKSYLKIHNRIHTGEKPFPCIQCEKSFNRKGDLKTHTLIHTNEKSFVCPECNKSFNQKPGLKKHMLKYKHIAHISNIQQLPTTFQEPFSDLNEKDKICHNSNTSFLDHDNIAQMPSFLQNRGDYTTTFVPHQLPSLSTDIHLFDKKNTLIPDELLINDKLYKELSMLTDNTTALIAHEEKSISPLIQDIVFE